jgi:multidrug efflux pump subunit AcrA (membrane-fusion protein)
VALRRYVPLLVVAGLLSACSGGSPPAKIRLGSVGRADVAEVVQAPATVTARATAALRSPADGTIKRLEVTDGDTVHAGEVVARISSPAAQDQLKQAQDASATAAAGGGVPAGINLSAFRGQADRSASDGFKAARKIAAMIPDVKQRALVLAQITKAEAQYASASAAAQSAVAQLNAGLGSVTSAMASIAKAQSVQTGAALRAAQRVVDGLVIRAPFEGVVSLGGSAGSLTGQLPSGLLSQAGLGGALSGGGAAKDPASIAEGAPISSGDAVVTVTDVSSLSLSADVDENNILQVQRGVSADVQLDAVQNVTYTAKVTGIGVTPKEVTGGGVTYRVTLTLQHEEGVPWPKPGMSAVVQLKVKQVTNALSVPSSAVVTSGKDTTVWLITSSGRAERRVVRLGAQGDQVVQILSGVAEGDRIVVHGADAVTPGQSLP